MRFHNPKKESMQMRTKLTMALAFACAAMVMGPAGASAGTVTLMTESGQVGSGSDITGVGKNFTLSAGGMQGGCLAAEFSGEVIENSEGSVVVAPPSVNLSGCGLSYGPSQIPVEISNILTSTMEFHADGSNFMEMEFDWTSPTINNYCRYYTPGSFSVASDPHFVSFTDEVAEFTEYLKAGAWCPDSVRFSGHFGLEDEQGEEVEVIVTP